MRSKICAPQREKKHVFSFFWEIARFFFLRGTLAKKTCAPTRSKFVALVRVKNTFTYLFSRGTVHGSNHVPPPDANLCLLWKKNETHFLPFRVVSLVEEKEACFFMDFYFPAKSQENQEKTEKLKETEKTHLKLENTYRKIILKNLREHLARDMWRRLRAPINALSAHLKDT